MVNRCEISWVEMKRKYFVFLGDSPQPLRSELKQAVFHFWPQWLIVLAMVLTWVLVTFVPKFEKCGRGYLGPGGKHDQGAHEKCTGGKLNRRRRDWLA